MELFSKRVLEHEPSNGQLHLLNRRTLIVLAVIIIWILWLLAPSQSRLIQLLHQTSSPQVSRIFLQQLHARAPENEELSKLLIDNYAQLGELDEAIALAGSILDKDSSAPDWPFIIRYAQLLQNKYHQAKGASETEQQAAALETEHKLQQFFAGIVSPTEAMDARALADIAISMSMTAKGAELLLPHLESGHTSHQELVALSLQIADFEQAVHLQQAAFKQAPTLETATRLLDLYLSTGQAQQSQAFIANYQGALSKNLDYLRLTIDHSRAVGNIDTALAQSKILLALTPSKALKVSTAELAIAGGDFKLATALLMAVSETDSEIGGSATHLEQLHALYRWQGDIAGASGVSRLLLAQGATPVQLREGIADANYLGDVPLESLYYQKLAQTNQLNAAEYDEGLNAITQAQGTVAALQSAQALAALRPHDTALIMHQARLYASLGDYPNVIKQWHKLAALRQPMPTEAFLFANAYIKTGQAKHALQVLTTTSNWLHGDDEYLSTVAALAWETQQPALAQLTNEQLAARVSNKLDIYRYLSRSEPLKSDADIKQLLGLYQAKGNSAPLVAAIQASLDNEDQPIFAQLVEFASQDSTLTNNTVVLLYRAKLAKDTQQNDSAMALYRQILVLAPDNEWAINGLLWLAIDTQDHALMADIYEQFRHTKQDQSAFWLTFATAAQQLGRLEEANLWYQRVLLSNDHNSQPQAAVLLNYATLLDKQGEQEKAQRIRHYLASQLSEQLLLLPEGEISYRSLVALFVGEGTALQLTEQALINQQHQPPNHRLAQELFGYYLTLGKPDSVQAWHQDAAFSGYALPDWQKLALAMRAKDQAAIHALLEQSITLSVADRNTALQLTGQQTAAWQHGEALLGKLKDPQVERQLRQTYVGLHPDQVTGVSARAAHNTEWEITRYSLNYFAPYQPDSWQQGNWRLGTDLQTATMPAQLLGLERKDETRLRAGTLYLNPFAPDALINHQDSRWSFGIDVADGLGDQRLGLATEYLQRLNDDWAVSLRLAVNAPVETSQLLTLTGKDNTAGVGFSYQPTPREALSAQFDWHDISNRFGDDIAQGWSLNVRASEQLFFNDPAWQVYTSLAMQQLELSDEPLDGINTQLQGPAPLTSGDFVSEDYQRLAVGQRLWHGTPGLPGSTVPAPRYWLDTSLGYNVTTQQPDIAVSAGLGVQVLGNDEVSLSVDWQSQDQNGDQALIFSLGYSYRF
ncbi:tetratricopeptide repeat protein [Oceanisphaera sp. W20_SRM_FM3]|uniref:tetratricopeptide repeat protein n=1 Tax=Oceanisphaera sp. W20_SRM_FM3 TaxID=3240267 RepID=UPI003F9BDC31